MDSNIPDMGIYMYVGKIGSGASGDVYKVLNKDNGKYYALKLFKDHVPKDEIEREIKCLNAVKSICGNGKVYCFMEDVNVNIGGKDHIGIITEFLDGYVSMFTYVTPKTPIETIEKIRDRCIDGFVELANLGIAQNDPNPMNIMIRDNNGEIDVKIIDFGKCTESVDDLHDTLTQMIMMFAMTLYDFGHEANSWFFGPFIDLMEYMQMPETEIERILWRIDHIEDEY